MKHLALILIGALVLGGCSNTPSDSDQQKLAKDWSSENVAQAYEKAGKHAEAEEVRRSAKQGQQ